MNSLYLLNLWSLLLFIGTFIVSAIVYKKSECDKKLIYTADLTQQIILAVTLCSLAILLKDLTNFQILGKGLSFVILSNFYAAVFNAAIMIYLTTKRQM